MDAEGGVKVPTMIIRTQGKFKKGQFRYFLIFLTLVLSSFYFSQLVNFVDWMPTILDLAGYNGKISPLFFKL